MEMNMNKKLIIGLVLTTWLNVSWAGDAVTAKVLSVGTYGDGRFFVTLDTVIPEPSCETNKFDVEGSHNLINSWQSIAMAAAVSGKKVRVKTKGCYGGNPTMDKTNQTYFYLFSE